MAALGAPFHEKQDGGSSLNGLGWDWESFPDAPSVMICTQDKFDTYCTFLAAWAVAKFLSLQDIERAAGVMLFISAGFSIGKPDVAALYLLKYRGKRLQAKNGDCPSRVLIPIDSEPRARSALSFWAEFFPQWNRRGEVFLDFGPSASYECLGRCDASTDWGCGGFFWTGGVLLGFRHEWSDAEREAAFVVVTESTGVFELFGAVYWFAYFDHRCLSKRVQLELDNKSAVSALESGWSNSARMGEAVRFIRGRCFTLNIHLRTRHIRGVVFNRIADHLSHNRVPDAVWAARDELGQDLVMLDVPAVSPATLSFPATPL
jgi:hypothetical protein